MNTASLEIVETIDHLDFNLACDLYGACCDKPTYIWLARCCSLVRYSCDAHCQRAKSFYPIAVSVKCKECKQEPPIGTTLEEHIDLRPL